VRSGNEAHPDRMLPVRGVARTRASQAVASWIAADSGPRLECHRDWNGSDLASHDLFGDCGYDELVLLGCEVGRRPCGFGFSAHPGGQPFDFFRFVLRGGCSILFQVMI